MDTCYPFSRSVHCDLSSCVYAYAKARCNQIFVKAVHCKTGLAIISDCVQHVNKNVEMNDDKLRECGNTNCVYGYYVRVLDL